MRSLLVWITAAAFIFAANAKSQAAMKEIPYPAVKVELAQAYTPDAAFEKMQKLFAEAVAEKDTQALFALVGPTFVRMSQGEFSDQFDFGRDALHNFKVVFGFREHGKDSDGAVANGPFWDSLAHFAANKTFYKAADTLVCGPTAAVIVDGGAFERAKQKIGADDSVEWYFTVVETPATSTPGVTGPQVGRISGIAVPVLNVHPAQEGQSAPPASHLKVLLPTGKSGWISLSAAHPLATHRLCYALTSGREWKISAFDQAQ